MKTNKGRKSLKGNWGKVGAPPKPTKFPKTPFTMAQLFKVNSKGKYAQCELSLRTKVDTMLAAGELVALKPKKQAKGGVGRPKSVFVVKDKFNASKMVKAEAPVKTPARKTDTVAPVTVAEIVTPAVSPVPVVVETVVPATAPVETANIPGPIANVETPVIPDIAPEVPAQTATEVIVTDAPEIPAAA